MVAQTVNKPPAYAGDPGSVPEWGRSSGGGNDNPLQDSCLIPWAEEPGKDTVHEVAKGQK